MDEKIKEAKHKIITAVMDCVGAAVLACWCIICHFEPDMVPPVPGFQRLSAFVLGFSIILMPYGLYRAVRDYEHIRRDAV